VSNLEDNAKIIAEFNRVHEALPEKFRKVIDDRIKSCKDRTAGEKREKNFCAKL
jgi:hypothetical protein